MYHILQYIIYIPIYCIRTYTNNIVLRRVTCGLRLKNNGGRIHNDDDHDDDDDDDD